MQPGTHLISSNSRETTKCININRGLIEVVLVPRRGFQPLKWLTCDSVKRGSPHPGFAISHVTPEEMTTISHNSSEDVTFLTDEQALWVACVCVRMCEARFYLLYLRGLCSQDVWACSDRAEENFFCARCLHVRVKVKVKSNRIINVAAFYIMLNQTPELLPLEDQLSNLI